jgi:methionyl aminopeptidase
MVKTRTPEQLKLMRRSGQIAAAALKRALEGAKLDVSGLRIDEIAGREMLKMGGDWSYKTVPGYKFATCVNFNEGVVHGLPTDQKIEDGDLVSIDLAAMYKGWHTDCAWTKLVSRKQNSKEYKEKEKFLKVGEEALWLGIKQAIEGHTIGDISAAIQGKVEGAGYFVVRTLVGHGVGEKLHEDPEVPGYGRKGTGLILQEGMTLAIEVIYAKGTPDVALDSDGWTYKSADNSISGLFEMTVVVGKKKAEVLTDWKRVS